MATEFKLDTTRFNLKEGIATRAGRAGYTLSQLSYTLEGREKAEALAEAAADVVPPEGVQWCAWHALAVVHGTLDHCGCSPCSKAREEESIRLTKRPKP